MRRAPVALAVVLAVLAVVLAALLLRPPADVATLSPSSSPSPTTAPTSSPAPSSTQQGLYQSKRLGFALTLPPPWRKASCGNSDPSTEELPSFEQFTSAALMEEHTGHAGSANDRVEVRLETNSQNETPTQFAQRRYPGSAASSVTFAGRPAVEIRPRSAGGDGLVYFMAEGDRMYSVGYSPRSTAAPDVTTMEGILRSYRFLSSAERQALPDPTPIPAAAPTAQVLAGMLKSGFELKDVAALERLLSPCVSQGVRPGGGALEPRERFVSELRQQLAAGLAVTVDTNAIGTDTMGSSYTYVASRWNAAPPGGGAPPESPRAQTLNTQLIFGQTRGGFYWSGTLLVGAL